MNKLMLCVGSVGVVAMLIACGSNDDGSSGASSAVTARNGAPSRGGAVNNGGVIAPPPPATDGGIVSSADAGPPGCYAGQGTCEPTNPTACGPDQACDINGGTNAFQCFDPPNDAHLGDACNNAHGPFCAHGLACYDGKCATYCCDDSVCAAGTHCTETGTVGSIVIKVCQ